MPEQPPGKPPRLGFAGFEDSRAAAGHGRRKTTWPLRPMQEAGAGEAGDAGRFANAAEVMRGLGRRKPE
jgi:hypothetical protein